MPTDLDTLTKSVMASLHQPAEKATAWVSALNQSLITEKVQLVGLLQFEGVCMGTMVCVICDKIAVPRRCETMVIPCDRDLQ